QVQRGMLVEQLPIAEGPQLAFPLLLVDAMQRDLGTALDGRVLDAEDVLSGKADEEPASWELGVCHSHCLDVGHDVKGLFCFDRLALAFLKDTSANSARNDGSSSINFDSLFYNGCCRAHGRVRAFRENRNQEGPAAFRALHTMLLGLLRLREE